MASRFIPRVCPHQYSHTLKLLRGFFGKKEFLEVPTSHQMKVLASCEDPQNAAFFDFLGTKYPMMQTSQLYLEHELLSEFKHRPDQFSGGFYSINPSFRAEPNPQEGRHHYSFQLLEFEGYGGMDQLTQTHRELLSHLGYGEANSFPEVDYEEMCKKYNTDELEAEHELQLEKDYGPVVLLKCFPLRTSPFWNMEMNEDMTVANKIDVILNGVEVIGSASRSCNPQQMWKMFHTISGGEYAKLLCKQFGKKRVEEELKKYLGFEMCPRYGAGIGIFRLMKSLEQEKLLPSFKRQ